MSNTSVWTAYKLKMKESNNSISNRRVSKRLERRHRRDEEINKRRNLSDEEMEEESVPENECLPEIVQRTVKPTAGMQTKRNDRVDRLKKWQEEKKKKTHQDSKKPLFRVGGIQRDSEAVLFQKEIQQSNFSKPVTSGYKFTASAPKEIRSTNTNMKAGGLPSRQAVKVDVKIAPSAKSKVSASEQMLKKSKSSGVLGSQNPPKSALKKETKSSVKVPEPKPLRTFKSVISNRGPENNVPKITRQFTDMSKKLTIAATSKRNVPEISPKRSLRRVKSSLVKEVLPNKGIAKPLKRNGNIASGSRPLPAPVTDDGKSEQTSSDSQDQLSDAHVPSPKHSTPHILKSAHKRKSASSKRAKADGKKGSRRKSNRKSSKHLSPVQVAMESGTAHFFSDSENEVIGLTSGLPDKKQKTPARKLRNDVGEKSETSGLHASQVEAASEKSSHRGNAMLSREKDHEVPCTRSTRKSIRIAKIEQEEDQTVSNMEGVQSSAEDDGQILISTPAEFNVELQTPSRKKQVNNSRQKLQRSARKSTRLTPSSKEQNHVTSETESSQSSTDTGNDFLDGVNKMFEDKTSARKSLSKNPGGALRKSMRKSIRLAAMEDTQSSAESDDQVLTSARTEAKRERSTPSCKGRGENSRQILQKSGRQSNRFTSLITDDNIITLGEESNPLSTDTEVQVVDIDVIASVAFERRSSVSNCEQKMTHERKTPTSAKSGKINSSRVESPATLSVSSLESNDTPMDQENDHKASNSAGSHTEKDMVHPRRKSMRMLTYSEPEIVDFANSTSTPRKRRCLTPLSMTKSFSALACDSHLDKPVPMSVDADSTPESDQRDQMQSALTKRKNATAALSNGPKDTKRITPRSAGRSNHSDRRSTARGRRSRRSTVSTPVTDEQASTDEGTGERANSRRSSSVPRRTSRRSTVISVSDEGTAVGRNLELAVSYLVERQPVSVKASRILKELVVEKVDGESSFFEIPLDESLKSQNTASTSNTPLALKSQDENKQKDLITTPLQANASPMITPKSHRRARSVAPSSTFKEPGLPLSAVRSQTASSRRRKTEVGTPLRSPEEMIEILKKSPMVEMNRRKSRHCSTPVRPSMNTSALCDVANRANHSDPLPTSNEMQVADNSSVEKSIVKDATQEKYFRDLITKESDRLNSLCCKWNDIVMDTPGLADDVLGQIRSVVGKAQLLMDQRFKQFSGLIDNYAYSLGEKETNPSDLQGFWEMIYFQVEDVNNLFKDLDQLQSSGWQMKPPTPKVFMPKKKAVTKAPVNSKKVKSNFAAFKNDLIKRNAATVATSSNSENVVEIIM